VRGPTPAYDCPMDTAIASKPRTIAEQAAYADAREVARQNFEDAKAKSDEAWISYREASTAEYAAEDAWSEAIRLQIGEDEAEKAYLTAHRECSARLHQYNRLCNLSTKAGREASKFGL